jgi:surface carbohydrate biosynthesis protein (TIGR04326 family)
LPAATEATDRPAAEPLLIWDVDASPPPRPSSTRLVLWRAFGPSGGRDIISIPRIVENDASDLRARYLGWIFDLGNHEIGGQRVIEALALRSGFSYWWMTLLAHTPNFYESPHIIDVLKCLVLERFLGGHSEPPPRVAIVTANDPLAEVLRRYCTMRGIPFTREAPIDGAARRRHGLGLPRPVMALLMLARGIARSLINFTPAERRWTSGAVSSFCLFDVLVHLQPSVFTNGVFASQYWTRLAEVFRERHAPTTWVHTFLRHAEVDSIKRAKSLLARFTRETPIELHGLIDGQLSPGGAVRVMRDYLILVRAFFRLRPIARAFTPRGSHFDFWPLFEANWRESLIGRAAMRNCLWLTLFERALARMPPQEVGVYVLENQPWEMALLHAWRRAGHGRIIGAPHATVRFWDLRYHYDPRSYVGNDRLQLPRPDVVALNGPAAVHEYREAGYPLSDITEVEALRYLHVRQQNVPRAAARRDRPLVLICGDNIPGSNERLMATVQQAAAALPDRTTYVFKPHKAAPFDVSPYAIAVSIDTRSLTALLEECDVVVTGGMTSAAVDAYFAGVTVMSMSDGVTLNASPFRGIEGVVTFQDPETLAAGILAGVGRPRRAVGDVQPFFHLDSQLPRWRRLLRLEGDIDVPEAVGAAGESRT